LTSELSLLYKSLERDVLVLKVLVGISLTVIAIIIATFVAFLVYFYKFVNPSPSKLGSADKPSPEKKPLELPTIYNNKVVENKILGENIEIKI